MPLSQKGIVPGTHSSFRKTGALSFLRTPLPSSLSEPCSRLGMNADPIDLSRGALLSSQGLSVSSRMDRGCSLADGRLCSLRCSAG